jgi:hypothetical protein
MNRSLLNRLRQQFSLLPGQYFHGAAIINIHSSEIAIFDVSTEDLLR